MGSKITPEAKPREQCFDSVKDSCFLVRWLRIHCFINLFRTMCRPLTKKEFFNTTKDFQPEVNYARYSSLRSKHPTQGFGRIIFQRQFLWALLWGSFVAMIAAGLSYAGPIFLKHIIQFINNKSPGSDDQRLAYMFAALWLVAYLFRIFFDQQAQWNCFGVSAKVEQIMNIAIYDKMVKMSSSDRRLFEEGDFMTFFTIDTRIVTTFIKSFYVLFSAPTTLITAQVFLYIEAGKYGLIMTGVVLLSLIFQVCICWKVAKLGVSKLGHFQHRIASNIEMFSSLKQIKSLGWEDLISKRNEQMRKPENHYNQRIFLYNGIYNFIVSFAPPLTIFLILAIHLAVNKEASFTATYVYTLISYIGLIYGPVNSLPSTIVAAIQTSTCSKRMDKLMSMEQKIDKKASLLPHGHVVIKHFVGSWNGKKSAVALGDSHVNKSTVKATKPINPATNSVDSSESGNMESAWNLCHPVDESVKGDFKIKIPYKISVTTGERLIVLGRSNSGKSSFFQSILGNVIREYGNLEVGGKISYVPQIPFLLRETIKNNIIFGGIDVKEKLDMVEEFVELTHELNKLEKYDSAILEDINAVLSPVMRQKISLARALYNDPDVFLIDDIFTEMDINSVKKLLNNFEKILPQKTLIISTVLTSIIRPNDLVLIFDQGTALEQGVFVNMVGNPSSYIHNFMRYESAVLEKMNIMSKQLTARCSIQQINVSMRAINPGKTNLSGSALYRHNHESNSHPTPEKAPERWKGVPIKFFCRFLRSGVLVLFLLLVLMLAIGQALNVFSVWWIGNAKAKYSHMTIPAIIGVYVGLVCGFGILSFLCCLLITYMSMVNTESLANRVISNVGKADLSWVEKQNKIFMTIILSRDNQEIFTVYNLYQSLLSNLFFYLGILILNGINSGLFFILGFGVLIINYLAVVLYIQAEREIFWAGMAIMREFNNVLEDSIIGVDTIRSYNRVDIHRQQFIDLLYKFNTVYKCNSRWILQGLSIFADVTGLAVTFGSAMFGIHNKYNSKTPTVVASAITLSNRLSSISSNISRDLANLEIQTRLTVNLPLTYGSKQPEPNYETPEPPSGWPHNASVRFDNVTFKDSAYEDPLINNLSFKTESYMSVAVNGSLHSTAVETFMMLINKLRQPVNGENNYPGQVFVGDVPLDKIGRKYLRNFVQMYDHSPFLFTSTLRNNLDPFGRYSDEEIREAMQKVGLWNEPTFFDSGLEEEDIQGKLNLKIEDGGINVSLGHKQLINISRALLQKPQVILCDFISSAVAPQKHRAYISRLLLEEFSSSTIFIATHDTSFLPHVDQKINLDNSEIELCRGSDGRPGLPSGGIPTFHAIQGTVSAIKNIPSIANGMQGT